MTNQRSFSTPFRSAGARIVVLRLLTLIACCDAVNLFMTKTKLGFPQHHDHDHPALVATLKGGGSPVNQSNLVENTQEMSVGLRAQLRSRPQPHEAQEEDILEEANRRATAGHKAHRWSVPLYALVLGLASGASMPIGAVLGVKMAPVKDTLCSAMMAFGAGALLFAVTVEIYGHVLHEVGIGHRQLYEIFATIMASLCGAMFYLQVNRWVEHKVMNHDQIVEEKSPEERNGSLLGGGQSFKSSKSFADSPSSDAMKRQSSDAMKRQTSNASSKGGANGPDFEDAASDVDKNERVGRGAVSMLHKMNSAHRAHVNIVAGRSWKKIRDALWRIRMIDALSSNAGVALHSPRADVSARTRERTRRERFRELFMEAMSRVKFEHQSDDLAEQMEMAEKASKAEVAALGVVVGLVIDGIAEGALMGLLAAEGHLTPVMVVSIFIGNFPEAFSSASLLQLAGWSTSTILGMVTAIWLFVGGCCGASCGLVFLMFPGFQEYGDGLPLYVHMMISTVEGITGGAMLACIATVMLPEAFERAGKQGPLLISSGFLCVCGFLLSVTLKAVAG
jgi:hypothetical protein